MQITAGSALAAITANEATIAGWTRNESDNRCLIITNYEHCRTDHVECGNTTDETEAQQTLERMANAIG